MNHRTPIALAGLVVALLAGCASQAPQPTPKPAPAPAPAPAPEAAKPAAPAAEPAQGETYSRLAGRAIKPGVVKPINVKTDCIYRDPTGYGGKLKLAVDKSQVNDLAAEIQVPKRGNCSFSLKDFQQTAKEPSVTLSAKSGSCTVRIWEQETKLTVAFNSCKDRCQGDSFDYVWPIIVNTKTGKCS